MIPTFILALLFFLLAFDTLTRFRIRWGRPGEARA